MDMCVCVCVCYRNCVGGWWGQGIARAFTRCMMKKKCNIYIYIYICMCVRVCVCKAYIASLLIMKNSIVMVSRGLISCLLPWICFLFCLGFLSNTDQKKTHAVLTPVFSYCFLITFFFDLLHRDLVTRLDNKKFFSYYKVFNIILN